MKTLNLLPVSLLAAAAIAALLVSPAGALAAVTLAGTLAIFAGDYRPARRAVRLAA